jgi:flagellar M-ring protein FliF
MDTAGHPLTTSTGDPDEPMGAAQVERQHQYEQQLAGQVVSLLEPVVGDGAVRASVAARLFLESEDRVEEKFGDPVILSEDIKEQGSGARAASQGIAGSRANLPGPVAPGATEPDPPTVAAASSTVSSPFSRSQTTNYNHSKTTVRSVRPRGGVARLSVAVLVDDERVVEKDGNGRPVSKTRPRTPEQMQKLHEAVMAAVGLEPSRGDQLTVQNIAFTMAPVEEPETPGTFEKYAPQIGLGLKVLVLLVLGTAAFFFVGRPLLRRRVLDAQPVDDPLLPRQLPRTIEEIEGEIAYQLDANGQVRLDRRLPVLTKRLTALAQSEPELAARLVRTWLLEDKK